MAVPTKAEIMTYFTMVGPRTMITPIAMAPANTIQLAQLCPIPHAWVVYFLDSKTPFCNSFLVLLLLDLLEGWLLLLLPLPDSGFTSSSSSVSESEFWP